MPEKDVAGLARKVQCLLLDVDGVLTDGKIWLVPQKGEDVVEMKVFNSADGAGISLAHRAGLKTGVITVRVSSAVSKRVQELSITYNYQGMSDKREALETILAEAPLSVEQVCFVGDDILDIPIMQRVGFPVAVQNARPEVKAVAAYVTEASGGNGAVREIVELILKAQGKWDAVTGEFLSRR